MRGNLSEKCDVVVKETQYVVVGLEVIVMVEKKRLAAIPYGIATTDDLLIKSRAWVRGELDKMRREIEFWVRIWESNRVYR